MDLITSQVWEWSSNAFGLELVGFPCGRSPGWPWIYRGVLDSTFGIQWKDWRKHHQPKSFHSDCRLLRCDCWCLDRIFGGFAGVPKPMAMLWNSGFDNEKPWKSFSLKLGVSVAAHVSSAFRGWGSCYYQDFAVLMRTSRCLLMAILTAQITVFGC